MLHDLSIAHICADLRKLIQGNTCTSPALQQLHKVNFYKCADSIPTAGEIHSVAGKVNK
jgi:hypothetical protein